MVSFDSKNRFRVTVMAQFFVVSVLKTSRFCKFSYIAQGSPTPSDDAKLAAVPGGGLLIHPDLFAPTDFHLFC